MYINFPVSLKTSRVALIASSAGSGAKIILYSGTMPATPETAASGTVLATFTCGASFGAAANGVFTAAAIPQTTSTGTGTATWARVTTSAGVVVLDADVSALAGDGLIKMNTTSITTGGPVVLSSFVLTEA